MSTTVMIHCDREECETHAVSTIAMEAGFVVVYWGDEELHYCSVDCLLIGMAMLAPPMTSIHLDDRL